MSGNRSRTMLRFFFVFCFVSFSYGDLYNSSDPVVILTKENYEQNLFGKDNAWIIQFYNTWCGHCINFSPVWRQFLNEIKGWNHTIKAAVVDCSDGDNVAVCSEYQVFGTPTVRLFAANVDKEDLGEETDARSVRELKAGVVHFLTETQSSGNGSRQWVNLQPFTHELSNFFNEASTTSSMGLLFVDSADSTLSRELLLDIGKPDPLYTRRTLADLVSLPGYPGGNVLYFLYWGGRFEKEIIDGMDAQALKDLLAERFHVLGYLKESSSNETLDLDESSAVTPASRHPQHVQVFLADIENAITYAIHHEVALHGKLEGEKLKAFKAFLSVLVKYLPAREPVHQFLVRLEQWLNSQGAYVSGSDYVSALQELSGQDSMLPPSQPWKACVGSQEQFRGYPCGLWTTFHVLTISAFQNPTEPDDPIEVLRGVHGFVKYFFSCRECSRNFQKKYAVDAEKYVTSHRKSVLWLWRAHNNVNLRTKGTASEDPAYPKGLFPRRTQCPQCWIYGRFDEDEVLRFLDHTYGRNNLSEEGIYPLNTDNTGTLISENKQARVHQTVAGTTNVSSALSSKASWYVFSTLGVSLTLLGVALYFVY